LAPDGSLGSWSTVTPTAGKSRAAVSFHSFIFALNSDGTIERSAVESDGSLAPWVYVPATTINHRSGALAVLNNNLVILGGIGGTSPDHYTLTSVERASIHADGSLDPWSFAPSMLSGRSGFSTVTSGNFIYAVGSSVGVEDGESIEFMQTKAAMSHSLYFPIVVNTSLSGK
jgi:hypothetical protein